MYDREPPIPAQPSGDNLDQLREEARKMWLFMWAWMEDYKRLRAEHRDLIQDGTKKIRGKTVTTTAPSNGQRLTYNSSSDELEWQTP